MKELNWFKIENDDGDLGVSIANTPFEGKTCLSTRENTVDRAKKILQYLYDEKFPYYDKYPKIDFCDNNGFPIMPSKAFEDIMSAELYQHGVEKMLVEYENIEFMESVFGVAMVANRILLKKVNIKIIIIKPEIMEEGKPYQKQVTEVERNTVTLGYLVYSGDLQGRYRQTALVQEKNDPTKTYEYASLGSLKIIDNYVELTDEE